MLVCINIKLTGLVVIFQVVATTYRVALMFDIVVDTVASLFVLHARLFTVSGRGRLV